MNKRVSRSLTAVVLALAFAGTPVLAAVPAHAPRDLATRSFAVRVAPNEVLHVEATGTGDAVVIIPGLFGTAFGFRKVVEPLALAGHRVVVVEPLGVGASGRPEGADYSLDAQARRVAAVLDTLHITRATLLAHSVGSSVALRLALARPALVQGLVSIEGGVAEAAGTPGLRHALSMAGFLGHFGLGGLVRSKVRSGFRDSSGDPSWITDDVMAAYLAPLESDYGQAITAYKAMASAPEGAPLAPRLTRVRCPVVLLVGGAQHDGGVGADELALMHRLPAFSTVTVPGAGHWIQEERPQAVVDAVKRLGA